MNPINIVGHYVLKFFRLVEKLGAYLKFVEETFRRCFNPPLNFLLLSKQMHFVGNHSVGVIVMAAFMIGASFGYQMGYIFRIFGAESMIGAAASLALSRELAPVFTAFMVTGRAGSAMAAEIANMRVNEQIDAMKVLAVNPLNYLIAPRIVASTIMMPFLCGIFVLVGVVAAYMVAVLAFNIDEAIFVQRISDVVKPKDLLVGFQKSAIFGLIFSSIGCYMGYFAQGGAAGVGRSTTKAVVVSLVAILMIDLALSFAFYDPNKKYF